MQKGGGTDKCTCSAVTWSVCSLTKRLFTSAMMGGACRADSER